MRYRLLLLFFFFSLLSIRSQDTDLQLRSDMSYHDNEVLSDLMAFQGIEYFDLSFEGEALPDKKFIFTAKEIWDGQLKKIDTIINSTTFPIKKLQTINEKKFDVEIIAQQLIEANKLKVLFDLGQLKITRYYELTDSKRYSLRNLIKESGLSITYKEPFVFLAYIMPYKRDDGGYSYCDVGSSGKDIDNWGKKFGIEHYIIFEANFVD